MFMSEKVLRKDYTAGMDELCKNIVGKFEAWMPDSYRKCRPIIYEGRKYDKIVDDNSVWGFVAKTNGVLKGVPYRVGDVFKPASWHAPAKHVRGSIFDDDTGWFDWTGPNYL
jgi:hypothetical protein